MGKLLICLMSLVSFGAVAAPEEAPQNAAAAAKPAGKKTTDMNFEDLLIQGKYHFSDEAVATVEQDKVLDGLLDIRKDFKDRIKQSTARY